MTNDQTKDGCKEEILRKNDIKEDGSKEDVKMMDVRIKNYLKNY